MNVSRETYGLKIILYFIFFGRRITDEYQEKRRKRTIEGIRCIDPYINCSLMKLYVFCHWHLRDILV